MYYINIEASDKVTAVNKYATLLIIFNKQHILAICQLSSCYIGMQIQ